MTAQKKKVPWGVLIGYYIALWVLWGAYTFWGAGLVGQIKNDWITEIIESGIIKNLLWTLPAFLLLRHYDDCALVKSGDLFQEKIDIKKYGIFFVAFAVYILAASYIANGTLGISSGFAPTQFITVLFVGITEEMVFRGWLFNVTVEPSRPWPAIVGNALLFLAIHFPRWIHEGIFISSFSSLSFASIVALSMLFSWLFLKTKNLLLPVALHMFWDLLMFVFY